MYCQVCGTKNSNEREYCRVCSQRLLVISGPYPAEEQDVFEQDPEEQMSFDEHLLERISILEEVVRRTAETLRQLLTTTYKLEQKILFSQTGITTLRDLLESKQVIHREEWSELWESRTDHQLLALEKRERFARVKERIAALYRGERKEEFRRLLDHAEYAFLGFDIEGAVRALETAYQLDLKNYQLAFFLAETFFNEGETQLARTYFDRVLAIKPNHHESLVYCGVLCHEHGDAQRAEDLLKKAVALYPDAFLPAFSLGAVYASEGHLASAVRFLERAVAADPIPQAYYLLGSCSYEMGRVTPAIRYLEAAVRQDPLFEEAHYLLGLAYLDRRWYRKALTAFRETQRLNPARLTYRDSVQLLLGHEPSQLPAEAAEWMRRAEDAMQNGHLRQALSCYRRALSLDAENPALLTAYAMACLELGRAQEIEPLIDKVLRLSSEENLRTTAYATLIEALRTEGKYREGNRIGKLMLDEGASAFSKTLAYYEMAFNLAEMEEELDQALGFARLSLESSPDELKHFSLAALGWVHYKRQEFEQAIDCLTRAHQLGPSARTLTHLGMALLASGKREPARSALIEARSLQERNPARETKVLKCIQESARSMLRGVEQFRK